MKKRNKLVSLALCAAVLFSFTACGGSGGGGGGNITYGRYVEEDITPSDMDGNVINFYYDESGVMDLITMKYDDEGYEQGYRRFRSENNGKSWQSLDMAWADKYITDYSGVEEGETPEAYRYMDRVEIMPDGSLIAVVSSYFTETEKRENNIISASLEGVTTPVNIPVLAEISDMADEVYINNMLLIDENRVALDIYVYEYSGRGMGMGSMAMSVSDDGSISGVFDINTGEQLVDFSQHNGWNYFYANGAMYMEDEFGYKAYSLEDGTELDVELPDNELVWRTGVYPSNSGSCVGPDHAFYGVSTRGLMKLSAGMEEAELLMDGLNYSYGSPACWVNALYINGEEILMSVQDDVDGTLILRYKWDAKAPATSDKQLSVYSLYENTGVRLALSQFKKQNPEVTLSYESALNRDDYYYSDSEGSGSGMTAEDALRALSTELLAGKGPDVLILDDLPLQSYIDKGILEDLSDVVDGLDVFTSVIDPLRTEKGLYAIPSHFSIPVLFGQEGKVKDFESLDALLKEVENSPAGMGAWPDWESMTEEQWEEYYAERNRPLGYDERQALQFDSLDEVIAMLYETSAPAMYTEATGLDSAALRTYLEAVKAISDKYNLAGNEYLTNNVTESYVISMGGTAFSYSMSVDYYASHRAKAGYTQYYSPYTITNLAWSEYYSSYDGVYDEETDSYEEVKKEGFVPQTTDITYAPGLAQGVYFPQNMAGVCSTSGQKELAKEFVATMVGYDVQKYNWYTNGLPINKAAYDNQWEEAFTVNSWQREQGVIPKEINVMPLIDGLTTPYYTNGYLLEAIYTNAVPYCQGAQSLDTTIDNILKETEIYFAERQ